MVGLVVILCGGGERSGKWIKWERLEGRKLKPKAVFLTSFSNDSFSE
jgi:hypothetical protein